MTKSSLQATHYAQRSLSRLLCELFEKKIFDSESQKRSYISALYLLVNYFEHKLITAICHEDIVKFKQMVEKKHKIPKALNLALKILRETCLQAGLPTPHFMSRITRGAYPSKTINSSKGQKGKTVISVSHEMYDEGTIAHATCRVLAAKLLKSSPSNIADLKCTFRKIIEVVGEKKLLSEITIDDFYEIHQYCLTKLKSVKTWNKVLTALKCLDSYALSKKAITYSFIDKGLGSVKPSQPEPSLYSKADIKKVLNTPCKNELGRLLFLVSYHLSTRGGEAIALTHSDIEFYYDDTKQRELAKVRISRSKSVGSGSRENKRNHAYTATKTKETRMVTLDPIGTKLIKAAMNMSLIHGKTEFYQLSANGIDIKKCREQFIFINPKTLKPWQSTSEYSDMFLRDFLTSLDIEHLGLSKTRNTSISNQLDAGVSVKHMKQRVGHAKDSKCIDLHYNVINLDSEVDNMEKMNQHFSDIHMSETKESSIAPSLTSKILNFFNPFKRSASQPRL